MIYKPLAIALSIVILTFSATGVNLYPSGPEVYGTEAELSLYEIACYGTPIPPELFRALAMAESDEIDAAVGDDGRSIGRFQINERFRAERVRLYGEYDPHDPMEAARVATGILAAHFKRFGSWALALTAYNAGAGYAARNGVRRAYVARVQMMLERIGSDFVIQNHTRNIYDHQPEHL